MVVIASEFNEEMGVVYFIENGKEIKKLTFPGEMMLEGTGIDLDLSQNDKYLIIKPTPGNPQIADSFGNIVKKFSTNLRGFGINYIDNAGEKILVQEVVQDSAKKWRTYLRCINSKGQVIWTV